jgi:hypothetical protein
MQRTMRTRLGRVALSSALLGSLAVAALPAAAGATGCLATGALDRDGTPLTAKLVNPRRPVTGRVDATGCSVGIYFSVAGGTVTNADVFGARYYGVLVDGNGHDASADVRDSKLHDIGDPTLSSSRHGQGVAYRGFGGTATGTARGNKIWNFQEAGVNATGPGSTAAFDANVITGRGLTDVISQNGAQVIFGAHGTVRNNVISDLRFSGPNVGNGVLVVGGPGYGFPYTRGSVITGNRITGTDVGVNIFEVEEDFSPSPDPTNIRVAGNVIRNDHNTNLLGWDGVETGFAAGIADYANHDTIVHNVVAGAGYDPDTCGASVICAPIFTDGTIDPIVSGNVIR